ncbi:hypothetical protein CDS [Bradyrhizobium sp.]|nr:hypothetical protein CDS [Bradyrhizobium sp.]
MKLCRGFGRCRPIWRDDGPLRPRPGGKFKGSACAQTVMPGHSRPKDGVASARLCPGIHVLRAAGQGVDGRDKPGHDVVGLQCVERSRPPGEGGTEGYAAAFGKR